MNLDSEEKEEKSQSQALALPLAVILFVFAFGLVEWGERPPVAKSPDAPVQEFSAGRSRQLLEKLVGDGMPHPAGSAADAAVRERIIAELKRLGYSPQIQESFACDPWGACAEVRNVVAVLPGRQAGPAVLLAAHYDSVAAGPGASDDGAGVVTILEIARALKTLPQPRNSIVILIDEGEEAGLLGAIAFIEDNPLVKGIRAAVNVDTRGTSGPSLMFETGNDNAWLLRLYAAFVAHPATSSFYYFGYKQLPNDTDFTIFKKAGITGFNFAYIGDEPHYHTPLDNVANADPRSLQHDGDNALATLRALADTGLENHPKGDAVFFDLFGRWTIWWPERFTLLYGIICAILWVVVIVQLGRRDVCSIAALLWGMLTWFLAIVAAALAGLGFGWLLHAARAAPSNWLAYPLPALVAFWGLGVIVVSELALVFSRRANFWGLWIGVWTWWTILALVAAWWAPSVSYVLLIPPLAAALLGLLAAFGSAGKPGRTGGLAVVPAAVAAVMIFSVATFFYDALGVHFLPAITILIALLATTIIPLLGGITGRWRRTLPDTAIGVTVVAVVIALVVPAYSEDSPERMNIAFVQEGGSGKAQWVVHPASGRLPETFRHAAAFSAQPAKLFPWEHSGGFAADAPNLDLPAPELADAQQSSEGELHLFRARLRSPRGAPEVDIALPPSASIDLLTARGASVPNLYDRAISWRQGWRIYSFIGVPPEGLEVEFRIGQPAPVEIYLLAQSSGLPLEGLFLLKDRPANAVPSHDGDMTIISRRIRLAP